MLPKEETTPSTLITLQINQQQYQFSGRELFINLSTLLRDELHLSATKVACEEGDCGACTVLLGTPISSKCANKHTMQYQVVNSCIIPVFSLDATHIITLEGLNEENLSTIQKAMVTEGGAQCGFCTPGMIVSLVAFFESHSFKNKGIEKKTNNQSIKQAIREKLKGNLCRCTGYQPIINAALSIKNYQSPKIINKTAIKDTTKNLRQAYNKTIIYQSKEASLWIPNTLEDALEIKNDHHDCQLCAGTTDLGVQWNKAHLKKTSAQEQNSHKKFLSLHKIQSLYAIKETDKEIKFSALVSLQAIQDYLASYKTPAYLAFCSLLNRFASPQIKNRATLTGNIANASPVGDTLPFLMVMEAKLIIQSSLQGLKQSRLAEITTFFKAYKQLALHDNEIITDVILPKPKEKQQCFLYKVSQRYDVDIACVSAAFLIQFSKNKNKKIKQIRIAFGGIAPCVIRLYDAEKMMQDCELNQALIDAVISLVCSQVTPLSDIRGSDTFRLKLIENLFRKFYFESFDDNFNMNRK